MVRVREEGEGERGEGGVLLPDRWLVTQSELTSRPQLEAEL